MNEAENVTDVDLSNSEMNSQNNDVFEGEKNSINVTTEECDQSVTVSPVNEATVAGTVTTAVHDDNSNVTVDAATDSHKTDVTPNIATDEQPITCVSVTAATSTVLVGHSVVMQSTPSSNVMIQPVPCSNVVMQSTPGSNVMMHLGPSSNEGEICSFTFTSFHDMWSCELNCLSNF